MANSNCSGNQPARSISLPSRPHPKVAEIEEQLSSLRSSRFQHSLGQKLNSLKDLYDCLDELLAQPQNQFKLIQKGKGVEELLDGSLRLLDVCGTAKDALSQLKEHIKEIQSCLRRRSNGGDLSIGEEVCGYVNMRKNTKAMLKGCLKDVRFLVKRRFAAAAAAVAGFGNVVHVLNQVEWLTAGVFEELLALISGSKGQLSLNTTTCTFPFVMCRVIMYQNRAFHKPDANISLNEFEDVDVNLSSLLIGIIAHKKSIPINLLQAENLRTKLVKLDSTIQDLDEALQALFRCLVKTRATLLNIFSH